MRGALAFVVMFTLCAAAEAQAAAQDSDAAQVPDAPQPQASETSQIRSGRTDGSDAVTLRNTPLHLLHDQGGHLEQPVPHQRR